MNVIYLTTPSKEIKLKNGENILKIGNQMEHFKISFKN